MTVQTRLSKPVKKTTGKWGGRTYTTPEGKIYPSVTTILNVIAKPALVNWAAKTERELTIEAAANLYEDLPVNGGKMSRPAYINTLTNRIGKTKAYQKEVSRSQEIGSQVHALVEWNLRKELGQVVGPEPVLSHDGATWSFMVYEEWRKTHHFAPTHIEQVVWSDTYGYAGTMDWVAGVDGITSVGEWKTAKACYPEHLLQVVAYIMALIEMGHATAPIQGYVVRFPKLVTDPEPEEKLITWQDAERLFPAFLAAKKLFDWQQKGKKLEDLQ